LQRCGGGVCALLLIPKNLLLHAKQINFRNHIDDSNIINLLSQACSSLLTMIVLFLATFLNVGRHSSQKPARKLNSHHLTRKN
jgi:hypothetical protein